MNILMAGCATEFVEVIRYYFCTYGSLVAFDASYCLVASGKREV